MESEVPVPSAGAPEQQEHPVARRGGRKRIYTDEERKAAARAARIKYEVKRGDQFKQIKTAQFRDFVENFRDESYPLVESRDVSGKYLCTICSSIVASHYNFKSHAKSKKHTTALETPPPP